MIEPAHMAVARRMAHSMIPDPWAADDAAQEAAIRIWSLLKKIPDAHEGAVVQAARWAVIDWLGCHRNVSGHENLAAGMGSWEELAEIDSTVLERLLSDPWPAAEALVLVRQALAAVGDAQQQVWVAMRYVLGMTENQVHDLTGLDQKTQRQRFRRSTAPVLLPLLGRF
jgi:DNA-directed RNA polymerase specialized sigma24 family protein